MSAGRRGSANCTGGTRTVLLAQDGAGPSEAKVFFCPRSTAGCVRESRVLFQTAGQHTSWRRQPGGHDLRLQEQLRIKNQEVHRGARLVATGRSGKYDIDFSFKSSVESLFETEMKYFNWSSRESARQRSVASFMVKQFTTVARVPTPSESTAQIDMLMGNCTAHALPVCTILSRVWLKGLNRAGNAGLSAQVRQT